MRGIPVEQDPVGPKLPLIATLKVYLYSLLICPIRSRGQTTPSDVRFDYLRNEAIMDTNIWYTERTGN